MNKDIKAITNAYNLGINHSTRNTDSYAYAPREYSSVRSEQDEDCAISKRVSTELNNMTKRASRGLREDYMYILANMDKLHKDLKELITKV